MPGDVQGSFHRIREAFATPPQAGDTERERIARIIKDTVSGPYFTDPDINAAHETDVMVAVDAILATRPSPAAVEAWQPISTAPKDGTAIDVWQIVGWNGGGYRLTNAKWNDNAWRWFDPHYAGGGGYIGLDNGVNVFVTHWMPLPAPPIPRDDRGESNG
jgi:hypothetical protein